MKTELDLLTTEINRAKLRDRRCDRQQQLTRPVTIFRGDEEPVTAFSQSMSRQGITVICPTAWDPGRVAVIRVHSLTGHPVAFRCALQTCEAYGPDWYIMKWRFIAAEKGAAFTTRRRPPTIARNDATPAAVCGRSAEHHQISLQAR